MKATIMCGAGDVRVEDVSDPVLREPTDAVVRVVRSCICGSDLWPYGSMPAAEQGRRMGHEFLGVVEELGTEVAGLKAGDVVVAPFLWADNTCDFCREGLHSSCRHGGGWGSPGLDGGQGEAVRVPQAQGTLVKLPVGEDSALLASLAAKRPGAEQIILMGRHTDRTDLGRGFGATDVVTERGDEAVEKVRALTGGDGTHAVIECVGTEDSLVTALGAVRDGGAVSRLGVSQYTSAPMGFDTLMRNVTLTGGIAPARAYIEELLPDVLDGKVEPGKVFDREIGVGDVPDGYRAMADRTALKVMIAP